MANNQPKSAVSATPVPQFKVGTEERHDLLKHLHSLGRRILLVGDIGLDEYLIGEVRRISPEAPVPILEVEKEDMRLGLVGNVAQNIVSLGGEPIMVTVVGRDRGAEMLFDLCRSANVSTEHWIVDGTRPTTRKTRVMAQHHHVVRVDHELRKYITTETETLVLAQVEKHIPHVDAVVIEDYAKGVVTQNLVRKIVELAGRFQKMVFVDPHRSNPAAFYAGVNLIKPNYDEAVAISGLKFEELRENPNKVLEVGRALQKQTGSRMVVLTRGKDGMTLFIDDQVVDVPTFARKVFDVTGAGDTVIAALSLGIASGLPPVKAAMLANFAAGVVVGKVGCVPCEIEELKEYIMK